jgi:hypothetical protein
MEMKGGGGGGVYGVYVYGVYTISRSAVLGRIWYTSEVGEGYAVRDAGSGRDQCPGTGGFSCFRCPQAAKSTVCA